MTKKEIKDFQKVIWDYYKVNKRSFAWRETTDPYKILVSEIMLQQTQTGRVISKYEEFLKAFPALPNLAKADLVSVLRYWSGLGYNRRAKFLLATAQKIVRDYHSTLPQDLETVRTFPGLGKATAASVLVFSYDLPLVFIETNIRRVYLHFFFRTRSEISDKEIEKLVKQTLPSKKYRDWYYALMDYGAMLKSHSRINPNTRSKHYKVQSSFAGSIRKVRGEIIRILLKRKTCSFAQLNDQLMVDETRLQTALNGLIREDFIIETHQGYSLVRK